MKMTPKTVRATRVTSALPRLRSVEAAKLLEHQMYFWGKDVLRSGGKLTRVTFTQQEDDFFGLMSFLSVHFCRIWL